MNVSKVIESTRAAITEAEAFGKGIRTLREAMSRVPPDQLSQTDLLAMRAGMLRNLETFENLIASHVKLLKAIVGP